MLALVGDEGEVREIDGGDHERHEGVAAVVLRVREDGEVGFEEVHLCVAIKWSELTVGRRRDHTAKGALRTDFSCYVRIQSAKHNVTIRKFARLALLDDQVAHGAHGRRLLPLDSIAVLLACGLGGRADGNKLEKWVILEQEDEALAYGACGTEDT